MNSKNQKPNRLLTENGLTPEREGLILMESEETLRDYKLGHTKGYESAKDLMQDILCDTRD